MGLGISSCVIGALGWQIASLFASLLTAALMVEMMLCFRSESKKEKRSNIFGLTVSIIDVLTGVLSVLFAAVSIATIFAAGLMVYKAVKIGIQTEKTIKLSDNIVKIAGKYTGKLILIPFLRRIIKNFGGNKMEKFKEILRAMSAFLKRNKLTTAGTVVAVLVEAVAVALADYLTYVEYIATLALPDWAKLVIAAVIGVVVFVVLVLPTILSIQKQGNETQAQYDARIFTEYINKIDIDNLTLDDADKIETAREIYDNLSDEAKALVTTATIKILTDAEAKIVELQTAQSAAEATEAALTATYTANYAAAVSSGTFDGSLEDYIVAQKNKAIKAKWIAEVAAGTYTGSFDSYQSK